jgi:hypothetical protein
MADIDPTVGSITMLLIIIGGAVIGLMFGVCLVVGDIAKCRLDNIDLDGVDLDAFPWANRKASLICIGLFCLMMLLTGIVGKMTPRELREIFIVATGASAIATAVVGFRLVRQMYPKKNDYESKPD